MFRPKEIKRLVKRKAKPWSERQRAALLQQRLGLGEAELAELADLEQIPWSFAYEFTCDDDRCRGHELGILDWEIGESSAGGPVSTATAGRRSCARSTRSSYLAATCTSWSATSPSGVGHFEIIGLVRPPRPKMVDGGFVQESLDLMGEQRPVAGAGVGLEAEQADPLGLDEGKETLELFPGEA